MFDIKAHQDSKPVWRIYFRKKLILIFLLGIASGMPLALIASTLTVWLTETGVDLSSIGLFVTVGAIYSLKFLWSFVFDHLYAPIIGKAIGKRKGWILLTSVFLSIAIINLGGTDPSLDIIDTYVAALFVAFFSSIFDINYDALRIEILKPQEQSPGVFMSTAGYRIGLLISGAGALFLAENYDWFYVYGAMAVVIFAISILSLTLRERSITEEPANIGKSYMQHLTTKVFEPIIDFTKRPHWVNILLVVLLFKLGDAFAGVMTNSFLIQTGFSKAEIAEIVKIFGLIATLAGAFTSSFLIYRYGMMKTLWISAFLQMFSNFAFVYQAWIGYDTTTLSFVIGIENFTGGMGANVIVCYLSSLCNISYTASQYAILSALSTFGRNVLSSPAGYVAQAFGWVNFFIISAFVAVPGIIALFFLINYDETKKKKLVKKIKKIIGI